MLVDDPGSLNRGGCSIGRIGVLAASLGVGAVILAIPAVANADDASPGSSLPATQATQAKATAGTPTARRTTPGRPAAQIAAGPSRDLAATSARPAAASARRDNAGDTVKQRQPSRVAARAAQVAQAPSIGELFNYTFFHKSATALPEQASGQSTNGAVTGNLNASSPGGANMVYAITKPPENGDVLVGQDGSYTFIPNLRTALLGGKDTFEVTIDNGSAYRLTGIGGAIQAIFSALAQAIGLRQSDTITVQVPVTVASTIVAIPVGKSPFDVVVSPDGRLVYTANYDDNAVAVIDTATGTRVRAITVSESPLCDGQCKGPTSLAINADGSRLYAVGGVRPVSDSRGSLSYFQGGSPITVIDTASGLVLPDRIDTVESDGDLAITPDGRKIFLGVNGWGLGQPQGLRAIDLTTGASNYFGVTSYVIGLSPDGKTVSLIDWRGDSRVSTFDVATSTELWSASIQSSGRKFFGNSIAISNDRAYVNVVEGSVSNQKTAVAVLSLGTGSLIALVETGNNEDSSSPNSFQGIAASPDGKRIYAVNAGQATLSVIDTSSNTLIANLDLGVYPWGVAVSPDSKYVYVTDRAVGTLSVIPV